MAKNEVKAAVTPEPVKTPLETVVKEGRKLAGGGEALPPSKDEAGAVPLGEWGRGAGLSTYTLATLKALEGPGAKLPSEWARLAGLLDKWDGKTPWAEFKKQ
jgi:hypothetical protein